MSFKDNLKAKIKLDRLVQNIASTMRETPGHRRLDKQLMLKLLHMTDFQHKKVRDLNLYTHPLEGEIMEVLVFDNELAIYHTTVDDVALRKSPDWKEMFSISNIKKVLNDQDVVVSKGKESLKRIQASAVAQLDLTYTRGDMTLLVDDAREALEEKSLARIQESFDLFFELLGYEMISLSILDEDLQASAKPKMNGGLAPLYENLILFDEKKFQISLRKGSFSPTSDSDLAWVRQFSRGEKPGDVNGVDVFEFLAEIALAKKQS